MSGIGPFTQSPGGVPPNALVGDGVVELVEAGRPLGIARDEEPDAAPVGLVELAAGIDLGEALRQHLPPGSSGTQRLLAARAPAPICADE